MSVESRPIGHHVVRLEEVESTNTLVLQNPDYLEHHGLVVLARHQTGGRGRMGRRWASLPGQQLQFTVVLHPILPPEDFSIFSLLGGVAVAQAVEERVGLSPRLKWPNDIMVDGGKVCGILLESRPGPAGATAGGHRPAHAAGPYRPPGRTAGASDRIRRRRSRRPRGARERHDPHRAR